MAKALGYSKRAEQKKETLSSPSGKCDILNVHQFEISLWAGIGGIGGIDVLKNNALCMFVKMLICIVLCNFTRLLIDTTVCTERLCESVLG